MSRPLSRRAFLKLTAACGAAVSFRLPAEPLNIGAAWPAPGTRHYHPNPTALLEVAFDLLLVPAYIAGAIIAQGRAAPLPTRAPQRAHDPDGAFTKPYFYGLAVWVAQGAPPTTAHALATRRVLGPDFPRLWLAATLPWVGHAPNTRHPGHCAEAERLIQRIQPVITADPLGGLRAGRGDVALAILPAFGSDALPPGLGCCPAPAQPIALEYDWLIPRNAPRRAAAQAWLAAQLIAPPPAPQRATPLMA
jgi:hypothetical protein